MERPNGNQVLQKKGGGSNKSSGSETKRGWCCRGWGESLPFFLSFILHPPNANLLMQNVVDVRKLTQVQREAGQTHRGRNFSIAEHTNTSDLETSKIQLVNWDSFWRRESPVPLLLPPSPGIQPWLLLEAKL